MGDKNKKKLTFIEGEMQREEAVKSLEAVVAGLASGSLELREGDDQITLCPEDVLFMEMKAKQSGSKESLELELKWRKPAAKGKEPARGDLEEATK